MDILAVRRTTVISERQPCTQIWTLPRLDERGIPSIEKQKAMKSMASMALAVKELEPGEFHWVLMKEEADADGNSMGYSPEVVGSPYGDAVAAWVAGYLALRARLREAST